MDYQKHYDSLISSRRLRKREIDVYYEKHHILPKSMGGENSPENLVYLTAREHFLAHWLLWKIHGTAKAAFAFHRMKLNKHTKEYDFVSGRLYAIAREAAAFATKEMHRQGKYKYTEERKEKLRDNPDSIWGSKSQSKSSRARWEKMSTEQRNIAQTNANLNAWKNCTDAEKIARQNKMQKARIGTHSAATKKGWENSTEEQRKLRSESIKKALRLRKFLKWSGVI